MGGLNASRFNTLRLAEDAKRLLFGSYFDLQIASAFLRTVRVLEAVGLADREEATAFAGASLEVVGGEASIPSGLASLDRLEDVLGRMRRSIDLEINRAVLEGRPPVVERVTTPGEVFFALPELAANHLPAVRGLTLTYLLDELENLAEFQQEYVHSLIRERREPVGLVVGGRTYGILTSLTQAGGESNRSGAEFDPVPLDDLMREDEAAFRKFCVAIAERRLEELDIPASDFSRRFDQAKVGRFGELIDWQIRPSGMPSNRLRRRLADHYDRSPTADVDVASVVAARCAVEGLPLLEKAAVLLTYQLWSRGKELLEETESIPAEVQLARAGRRNRITRLLDHFKADLMAQLRRENGRYPEYSGFATMGQLADGNVRSFVNLMKLVYSWAEFEAGSSEAGRFSLDVQRRAVLDASDWFYGESQVVGSEASRVRTGVDRLGEMLEKLRYADKPVESSLCAVTVDMDAIPPNVRRVIESALGWSLLVRRPSRIDRNEARRLTTIQINRMLAPRWSLPVGRRGIIDLSDREVVAIFGDPGRDAFEEYLDVRLRRMNAPFNTTPRSPNREALF
jgi:hypothetical protein